MPLSKLLKCFISRYVGYNRDLRERLERLLNSKNIILRRSWYKGYCNVNFIPQLRQRAIEYRAGEDNHTHNNKRDHHHQDRSKRYGTVAPEVEETGAENS